MDIFFILKRYTIIIKNTQELSVFYKSEKSAGKSSRELGGDTQREVFEVCHQNILSHISSIFSKILCGRAYLSTSSHNNLPKTGNIKIVKTVTTTPITA